MSDRLRRARASTLARLALPLAVFAVVTALALAAGAEGLGVAATFGIVAFAAAMIAVLLTDAPPPPSDG